MMILTRRTILFYLVILCTPLSDVKPQTVANKKTATASISGTVTLKGKGTAGIAISVRQCEQRQFALCDLSGQDGSGRALSNIKCSGGIL